ncbi:enoyl-CoA hydratase/isomerase family protein [Microvirga arabica]|uniref:Enoyl-CoA hydratase/isomerase family protein n=1 Tax=Microvirga arabica TaxID=1128671 RepID=A0ABV6YBG1_9HYPH
MPDKKIRVEIDGRVATLFLSNPPLNVVTLDLTRQLGEALAELAANPDVGALVLTGEGDRAFCAGSDINEFPTLVSENAIVSRKLGRENEVYGQVAHFPKPTVAAIERIALGGGLELASGCDLVVVSEDAALGLPEVKLGGFPGSGGTVRVPQRIGLGRAKEMMLLGNPIDAQTALDWGLANRIAPKGSALTVARELAVTLAAGPAQALYACKAALEYAHDFPEDQAIQKTLDLSESLSRTNDFSEGVDAFRAKRSAKFGDRLDPTAFEVRD